MNGSGRPLGILTILLVALVGGIAGAGMMAWLLRAREVGFSGWRQPYVEARRREGPENTAFTEAIRRAEPAVVSIETEFSVGPAESTPSLPQPVGGRGSGVVIDGQRGYVLTNAHVVKGARALKVRLPDMREFAGRLVGLDEVSDIALLQIRGAGLPTAVLGRSADLPVGAWVIAIGNSLMFERSVTAGIISGKGRSVSSLRGEVELFDLLQTDAAINPGNSGGALVNLRGEVVGIPTAVVRGAQAEGLGFAVPIDRAKAVVGELLRYGRVRHPWLGILYSSLPAEAAKHPLHLPRDRQGALLLEIAKDSPAFRAGLRKGDVIRRAGEKVISNQEDLRDLARTLKVGERLPLLIWREGHEQGLSLVVGEMPAPARLRQLFPFRRR